MTRRRSVTALLAVAATGLVSAVAASATVPQAAARVRAAIPAIEVYCADRGTYVGLTLARIRTWDKAVRHVVVKRATKNAYCIQSTLSGPIVHFDGPKGPVRRGPCGVRGAVVRRPGAPSASTTDPVAAKRQLGAAIFGIETYAGLSGGYARMTLAKIQELDGAVQGIRVVWSNARAYCIESGVGAATHHLHGPGKPVAVGHCPSAP